MTERWVVVVEGNVVFFAPTAEERANDYAAQCRTHGKLAYVLSETQYLDRDRGQLDRTTVLGTVDRERDL